MKTFYRVKNKCIARLANRSPAFAKRLIASHSPQSPVDIPWAPLTKRLAESIIAVVTTAGIHHDSQRPFDMLDPMGDSSYRIIDPGTIEENFTITHDYYDHRDANKDLNIVFPITRLAEMANAGIIRGVAKQHYSFMGHISGLNLDRLIEQTAPAVAAQCRQNQVNAVILTPG